MHRALRAAAVLAALTVVAACGDDDAAEDSAAEATTPAADAFPVTVDAANGEVTLDARPERIVSLSPSATEILYAVGAGDQVEAVDQQSDYPEGVPTTDMDALEPNVEALLAYDPDLVIIDNENEEITTALSDLDIPVIVQPAAVTFDDVTDQIGELGDLTGHAAEGEEVAEDVASQIEELAASVPELDEPLTYYHELDDTYYTATSGTFIGEVYGLAGLENIADAVDDGSGYPQLTAEYIIDADPDLIFLADTECCGQTPETVAERPGWGGLTAVADDAVVVLEDDIVSRWGPRVVDFLETVVNAVHEVTPA
jgi:iron complex transport system substrate-binding protein